MSLTKEQRELWFRRYNGGTGNYNAHVMVATITPNGRERNRFIGYRIVSYNIKTFAELLSTNVYNGIPVNLDPEAVKQYPINVTSAVKIRDIDGANIRHNAKVGGIRNLRLMGDHEENYDNYCGVDSTEGVINRYSQFFNAGGSSLVTLDIFQVFVVLERLTKELYLVAVNDQDSTKAYIMHGHTLEEHYRLTADIAQKETKENPRFRAVAGLSNAKIIKGTAVSLGESFSGPDGVLVELGVNIGKDKPKAVERNVGRDNSAELKKTDRELDRELELTKQQLQKAKELLKSLKADRDNIKNELDSLREFCEKLNRNGKENNRRNSYQIVGRYLDGNKTVAYHLQDMDAGIDKKYTREQVYYLIGRGQITNCEAQIYQDKVLLRGVGMSLKDLPAVQIETGELSNTESVGHVRRGATPEEVMTQFNLVGIVTVDGKLAGYTISNSAGQTIDVKREKIIELAQEKKLGNATVQNYKGRVIIRGKGIKLSELPKKEMQQ